jgi:hypothetical protein
MKRLFRRFCQFKLDGFCVLLNLFPDRSRHQAETGSHPGDISISGGLDYTLSNLTPFLTS